MTLSAEQWDTATVLPTLDRTVAVIGAAKTGMNKVCTLNDLQEHPFVVLLGEPGSGKSATLYAEARKVGARVVTARELIYGGEPSRTDNLYVDALDEYRSEGAPGDKVWKLFVAMQRVNATRWWVACRSEDWRNDADIEPFLKLTKGVQPTVVQLQALRLSEARQVLAYLGEPDPGRFVEKANALGANGFLQSPLSIKLLHRAVTRDRAWPSGRLALFDSATRALAAESNQNYESRQRLSAEQILSTAGRISLIMLCSGGAFVWHSNQAKPRSSSDRSQFVDADDLEIERASLSDVLDSSLFKGDGRQFEPVHRTIAEFLAAQTLARAVIGSNGLAAFPLSRASALICGSDGMPPTELRGLYAWFAAHLANKGDQVNASRLIEADAVSVLTYGDAATFPTELKRAILRNLDKRDPYFRASGEWWNEVVAFGGLACEALANDFAEVLAHRETDSHQLDTVFEVLTNGPAVCSLRPLLRKIILDTARTSWHRTRAVRAYLNSDDSDETRLELLQAVEQEAVSLTRETVRIQIAIGLKPGRQFLSLVKSILAAVELCPSNSTVGQLYSFQRHLEQCPPEGLFDEPLRTWRSEGVDHARRLEVDGILDHVLASMIKRDETIGATDLWKWLSNVGVNIWSGIGRETTAALTNWMQADPSRSLDLFDCILLDDVPTNGPWVAPNVYVHVSRRSLSPAIVEHLIARARVSGIQLRMRLLAVAVEIVRDGTLPDDSYWQVYEAVSVDVNSAELINRLGFNPLDPMQAEVRQREREVSARDAEVATRNVEFLIPMLPEIRTARRSEEYKWATNQYFATNAHPTVRGVDRIAYYSDHNVASAFTEGWQFVVEHGFGDISADDLGRADARGQPYPIELAAVAGVDLMLERGEQSDASPEVAIVALRHSYFVGDNNRRKRLENWAYAILAKSPEVASRCLVTYWCASLENGATDLNLVPQLTRASEGRSVTFSMALEYMLRERPTMPSGALKQILHAAADHLSASRLVHLATSALESSLLNTEGRRIWRFVAFYYDPVKYGSEFMAEHAADDLVDLVESYSGGGLSSSFELTENSLRVEREELTVRLFGRCVTPSEEVDRSSTLGRAAQIVHRALNLLSTVPEQKGLAALLRLASESELTRWHSLIRHAIATFNRLERDRAFRHPEPSRVREALNGGAPVNGADLMAVLLEELRRLASELQSDDVSPWKRYWNLDARGKPLRPLIENECRDRLLERLRDRLMPYKILPPMPEARRANETRADILAFSTLAHSVPIEAKRNSHAEIWIAASTQLQGYANAVGADGHGIYLVFWFGNAPSKTPSPPDGADGPRTAAEMETMLRERMPVDIAHKIAVVVLDVSDPGSTDAPPRRKRRGNRRDHA